MKKFYLWVVDNMEKFYTALTIYAVVGCVTPHPIPDIIRNTLLVFACFWMSLCNAARLQEWGKEREGENEKV